MGFLYFIGIHPNTPISSLAPTAMGLPLPLGHHHVASTHIINHHVNNVVCPDYDGLIIRQCKTINTSLTTTKREWQANYNNAAKWALKVKQYAVQLEKSQCGPHSYP